MLLAAVIVTFNPDFEVSDRIFKIGQQVNRVFVIDNSPHEPQHLAVPENAVFISNKNIGGLAGALNIALKEARTGEYSHLFLFDQDTEIELDFCGMLATESEIYRGTDYCIFGPRHLNSNTGHPVRISSTHGLLCSDWPTDDRQPIECFFLINSCSLLDLKKLSPKLLYDEYLAIDMIDVNFGLAARSLGFKSLCIPHITVSHGIGNKKNGGRKFSPTNYSGLRKYLQTRNRIIVWKRYHHTFRRFVLSDFFIWLADCSRTLLLEDRKAHKARQICRGIKDGIINRTSYVFGHSTALKIED